VTATKVRLIAGPDDPQDRGSLVMLPAARRTHLAVLAAATLLSGSFLACPPDAIARGGEGGGGEVRAAGSCGRGASSDLRLRSRDGGIRVRFQVEHARSGAAWRVVLVQDRRVVWRGRARNRAGSFELERTLRDLPGADRVTARAWGPAGVTCAAAATLPG
jgi:hypothetical protein